MQHNNSRRHGISSVSHVIGIVVASTAPTGRSSFETSRSRRSRNFYHDGFERRGRVRVRYNIMSARLAHESLDEQSVNNGGTRKYYEKFPWNRIRGSGTTCRPSAVMSNSPVGYGRIEKFIVGQLTGGGETRKQLFCRKKPHSNIHIHFLVDKDKCVLTFSIEFDITVISRFSGSPFQWRLIGLGQYRNFHFYFYDLQYTAFLVRNVI